MNDIRPPILYTVFSYLTYRENDYENLKYKQVCKGWKKAIEDGEKMGYRNMLKGVVSRFMLKIILEYHKNLDDKRNKITNTSISDIPRCIFERGDRFSNVAYGCPKNLVNKLLDLYNKVEYNNMTKNNIITYHYLNCINSGFGAVENNWKNEIYYKSRDLSEWEECAKKVQRNCDYWKKRKKEIEDERCYIEDEKIKYDIFIKLIKE